MPKITKTTRIKHEKERITKQFSGLPPKEMALMEGLIERAAWMRIECEDLEKDLQETGWTCLFQQSPSVPAYEKTKPQATEYQKLNAGYAKIMNQLERLLERMEKRSEDAGTDDGFEDFLEIDDE